MYGGDKEIVSVSEAENGYVVKTAKTDAEIKDDVASEKKQHGKDAPMIGSASDPDITIHETVASAMDAVKRAIAKHAKESASEQYAEGFKEAVKEHAGNKG